MKYTKQFDGDSVLLRDGRWRIGCCDCGLVHDLTFTKVRGGIKVGIRMNNRATAAKRRAVETALPMEAIAEKIGIGINGVKSRQRQVFDLLGVSSRLELMTQYHYRERHGVTSGAA